MRKLLLLFIALLTGVSGAWAALSSSTIAKSGNVTDTWNITSALPTDNWTAMGEETPAGVTALGSYTAYSRTQDITLSADGALFITFEYSSGNHQLEILGVELLNGTNEVVRSHYHYGKTGTYRSNNNYFLDHITSGNYKIRFIINSGVSSSAGNITIKHLNIKTASSYADISHWYFVRMNTNDTHYMYYNSGAATNVAFSNTKANSDKYLWGFVKDTEGLKIYNQAAGSSVAIDNANPCTLSASGQTFTIATGTEGSNGAAAEAYFALYKNISYKNDAKSYLNYNSAGIKRHSAADAGSTFMIDEAPIAGGKIYKIQAYFTNDSYNNLYFTNNNGTLAFNASATNGVKDYWILRSSGNADYPWKFESGRGDGKFLSPQSGISENGGWVQIINCGTNETYYHLYGSINDATTGGDIRNLATWSPDGTSPSKTGFAQYGSGGCYGGSHNNGNWSTDFAIEEVTGVDIYTVVSNINAGGVNKTTYTGKSEQTNGGYYILESAPFASDFTAISVDGYTAGDVVVDATAKTITVNYTANITYTLTDANGKTYSWSASGTFGTAPTLTGCDGYTLSNEVWNDGSKTYTATINFPFPVSSNGVTNWTYIGSFASLSRTAQWTWHVASAGATDINAQSNVLPTNKEGDIERWKWSIEPTFSDGNFTFKIKNSATPKYITMSASQHNHNQGSVTLEDTGTPLIWVSGNAWKKSDGNYYLSVNSYQPTPSDLLQYLGQHGSTHYGTNVGYITPDDFSTLMANLKTAYASYGKYFDAFNAGSYTQSVEGKMETAYANNGNVQEVIADTPTKYLKASEFTSYIDAYNAAINGLRYVMPTFFRVKNVDGSKYVKAGWKDYTNYIQLDFAAGGTDASSIFYLNASNSIISYYSGSYLFSINHTKPVSYDEATYRCTYEFLPGSDVNRVYVHVASNPSGWGGSETYWITTDTKVGRGTAPTANSDFLIEEVTSLPVTIGDAHYATFSAPVAVTVPEGVTAYYGTTTGADVMYLAPINSGSVIPANMGVILYAETPKTYNFAITEEEGSGTSILTGTTAAISWASGYYTLQKATSGDGVGLYGNEPTNSSSKIPGFKAYYNSNSPSGVKGYRFNFGDENGVKTLEEIQGAIDNNEIFDMSGRRIAKAARGLYIVNGKKLLVK